jgi:hypothetical protein
MPVVEVNDLASVGQINDTAPYMLAPEAWTLAENIRYDKNAPQALAGWAQVFGTPGVAPHFALPVKTPSQTWWLYVSLAKGYVFDGTTHTNITRQTAGSDVNYTANDTANWNGVVFGGVPILNNGIDVPQYWGSYSTATKLAALPNWPTTLRAKIIRGFGSYLVAFNVTDAGTIYPNLVQWSNPAGPGTVPTSWAFGNPAVEGGRKDLPDVNSGDIIEALTLQSALFIYKERSIWKMTYIGGQYIFQFDPFLNDVGILGPRCVCYDDTGAKHIVATQDDIIMHNGNTPTSILTDKQRTTLFDSMNKDTANTSFIFLNRAKNEVWFCFPEAGQSQPTRALIWNYKKGIGAISFASGITFRNAVLGDIQGVTGETWATGTDTWADDTGPWSQVFRQKIVLCSPDNTKFYQLDSGTTRDGVNFPVTLQREDLGIIGKTRTGAWINDFKQMKMVDALWPKVGGVPIRVRVGFRDVVGGPLVWQPYTTFNPATDMWINAIVDETLPGSGRAVSVEFSSTTAALWRLDGYSMNVEVIGPY